MLVFIFIYYCKVSFKTQCRGISVSRYSLCPSATYIVIATATASLFDELANRVLKLKSCDISRTNEDRKKRRWEEAQGGGGVGELSSRTAQTIKV